MLATGAFGLVTGLALLAAGAYQMLYSEPARSTSGTVRMLQFAAEPDEHPIYDRPVYSPPTPAPQPSPTPQAVQGGPGAPPPLRDIPYRLLIDKIGVNAPVGTYGLDRNLAPQVPWNGAEVAWYTFSAEPGAQGNAVFAGHVTWGGRAVFYDLDKLAPGDLIILEGTDGTRVVYEVNVVFLVDPDDPNALSVMAPTDYHAITLITCGGEPFYVGGSLRYDYTHRLVVRGSLNQVSLANSGEEPASGG
jgi:LPXTG-site transpeptidase (sortase) family protein